MDRRMWFGVAAGAAALALGATRAWLPGVQEGRLTLSGRQVMRAVARAVLDGMLPEAAESIQAALDAHLERVDKTVSSLPRGTQDELSQLLAFLDLPPGRMVLARLYTRWSSASLEELHRSLASMRLSHLLVAQQAYHALRDITNAAYFSEPSHWARLGYPGPEPIGS